MRSSTSRLLSLPALGLCLAAGSAAAQQHAGLGSRQPVLPEDMVAPPAADGSAPATGSTGLTGPKMALLPCTVGLEDMTGGACLNASSTPVLGALYPLSQNLFVDATTGNVGLGTTFPTERLQLGEFFTTNEDTFLEMRTTGGGSDLKQGIKFRSSNPFFGFDLQHDDGLKGLNVLRYDLDFGAIGTSALYVDRQNGHIGIGTTEPEELLQIGTNGSPGDKYFAIKTAGGNQYKAGLRLSHFADNNGFLIESDETGPVNGLNIHRLEAGADSDFFISRVTGQIGIGTTAPAHLLSVNGSAGKPGGGSWSTFSDERLKRNIHGLRGALDTLLSLRGVTFEYIDPAAIGELEGERIGFVAQEVEDVLPDWVEEGADGFKQLTIRGFEALAVESLRELAQENRELRERVARLESIEASVEELRAAFLAER